MAIELDADGKKLPGSSEPIPGKCAARLRKHNKAYNPPRYCIQFPMHGKNRCPLHGGKAKSGPLHGRYTTGLYCKTLPLNLREDYLQAVADPKLSHLQEELALITTRQLELTKKLSQLESPPWNQAQEAKNKYLQTHLDEDLDKLFFLLDEGAETASIYESTWAEIREIIQEKTKTAAAENKRKEALRTRVEINDVVGIVTALTSFVLSQPIETKIKQAVQNKLCELIDSKKQIPADQVLIENKPIE